MLSCTKKELAMFYRLWEAARNRPTRALGIAGVALIAGAVVHAFLTCVALVNAVTARTTLGDLYEGSTAKTFLLANIGQWFDMTAMFAGLCLTAAFFWRTWRGLK